MKKTLTVLVKMILLLAILICAICVTLFSYMNLHFPVIKANQDLNKQAMLPWSDDRNFVQTGNTCGGHALMAFLYSFRGEKRNPYYLYEKIDEKDKIGYMYFWGLTRYMQRNGIKGKNYYMNLNSRSEKETWIKGRIAQKIPVILLIKNNKALHYITILGYSENEFYIYDSLQRQDQNAEMPGNITEPIPDVFDNWEAARYKGIKINIATTL